MVERIRTLLETRQLTPTQFADSIGIARPIVSHILSGRNKPSLEVVQRILAAMPDLSMAWLLNGTGTMLAGAPIAPQVQPAAQAPSAPTEPKVAPVPPQEVVLGVAEAPVGAPEAAPNRSPSPETPTKPSRLAATGGGSAPPEPKRFAPTAAPAPRQPASGPVPQVLTEAPAVEVEPVAAVAAPVAQPAAPVVTAAVSVEAPIIPAGPDSIEATPATTALLARTEKPIRRIVIFYHDGSFADYRPE
ncbi:helix-turn-helix domain-containing protein [Hymenobacter glacialis]|uniref:helix-turn-helix domain-containing protein n=1 Tax=Hymenobacter glacialis TaxID=1908236 RepID=UPI0009F5F545|nr:helix-turn-helix transcriptional regulator [Hymenobacter glacialis]